MKVSRLFVRSLFVILSIFFIMAYTTKAGTEMSAATLSIGAISGLVYGFLLIGLEWLFRRSNLRSFNVFVVGLFFGYLMGLALLVIFKAVISLTFIALPEQLLEIIKIALFLFGTYLGVMFAMRAAD